jgi:hypothetical protein
MTAPNVGYFPLLDGYPARRCFAALSMTPDWTFLIGEVLSPNVCRYQERVDITLSYSV